jgi:hypothetical protein
MFVVTEADAAAIRAVYQQRGEFSAAVELRQRFPGITDNAQARTWARTIAGWKPLAALSLGRVRLREANVVCLDGSHIPRMTERRFYQSLAIPCASGWQT